MASSALQALATLQLVPSVASEALGPASAWLASVHGQQAKAIEHAHSSAERRGVHKQRGSSDSLASVHAAHGKVQTHLAAVYHSVVECMRVGDRGIRNDAARALVVFGDALGLQEVVLPDDVAPS